MKLPVGIWGASGVIGEEYIRLLKNHPWFEIAHVAASEKRVGEMSAAGIPFSSIEDSAFHKCALIFSALPNSAAEREMEMAQEVPVLSHASAHRMKEEVPLVIPEINPHHLDRLKKRATKGFLVAKPNCALFSFLLPLAPLYKQFPIKKLSVTTMQAVSGAGYGALAALDIHDNVIPYIGGEEEKLESEPLKILDLPHLTIAAQCNRVPVLHGHMACVSVAFEKKPPPEAILEAWENFAPFTTPLPSAPPKALRYLEGDRPQSRLDRYEGGGMGVTVGRLRPCPLLDYRFVGLSHNAVRGGAGGGVLLAELLHTKGLL